MGNKWVTSKRNIIVFVFLCCMMILGIWNHISYRFFYPFITNASGFSYKAMCLGNKKKAKVGDWVHVSFSIKIADKKKNGKLVKGRTFFDTAYRLEPCILQINEAILGKNLQKMFCMVEEKQRMVFKCLPKYYFSQADEKDLEKHLHAMKIHGDDIFVIDVKIDKIMTDTAYRTMVENQRIEQAAKDKQAIMAYLEEHKIQACSTETGLFYSIDQDCNGVAITKGKTVKIHYTGKFLDGTVFDTSLEAVAKAHNIHQANRTYGPLEIKVGVGQVIAGWDEGLLLLKKAQKARFFIPSALAYGKEKVGIIEPNSVLLFDVEVVDVY